MLLVCHVSESPVNCDLQCQNLHIFTRTTEADRFLWLHDLIVVVTRVSMAVVAEVTDKQPADIKRDAYGPSWKDLPCLGSQPVNVDDSNCVG